MRRPASKPAFLFARCLRRSRSSRVQKNKSDGTGDGAEPHPSHFVVGGQCKHVRRNSMTNRFMLSVAVAALIAGTGFANAQGTGMSREGGAAAGTTVQQGAPPSGAAAGTSATTTNHEATESTKPSPGMKATQSEPKSPTAGKNVHAQDDMK